MPLDLGARAAVGTEVLDRIPQLAELEVRSLGEALVADHGAHRVVGDVQRLVAVRCGLRGAGTPGVWSSSRGGRPTRHDVGLHKARNTVERLINKLKAWRGIATRCDKTPESYLAGLHLRASVIWINDLLKAAG
jgi:hypothetical protein